VVISADGLSGDPASTVVWRRPLLTTHDSEVTLNIARRWYQNCTAEHLNCPRQLIAPLPTRLIEVGSDASEPSIYISPARAQGVYAALSYCWGVSKQPVMLTRARLESKNHILPLMDLPATLRDAILICRRLGFQYVWIDALCIVQDSTDSEDWLRESANMANIYGRAALTITASAAKQTSDGILSASIPPVELKCAIPYNLGNGKVGNVFVVPYEVQETTSFSNEPLETRAWSLQERLLSPRVLKFETSQLVWDCLSTKINSNGPLSDTRASRARFDWNQIVFDYTGRNLTRVSDKLPALSGYARHIQSLNADTYLAGLWKKDIVFQLLWYVADFQLTTTRSRSLTYRAPSWSWASVDRRCFFIPDLDSSGKADIEILDVSAPTLAADPFG
jgi:hypothetical protein